MINYSRRGKLATNPHRRELTESGERQKLTTGLLNCSKFSNSNVSRDQRQIVASVLPDTRTSLVELMATHTTGPRWWSIFITYQRIDKWSVMKKFRIQSFIGTTARRSKKGKSNKFALWDSLPSHLVLPMKLFSLISSPLLSKIVFCWRKILCWPNWWHQLMFWAHIRDTQQISRYARRFSRQVRWNDDAGIVSSTYLKWVSALKQTFPPFATSFHSPLRYCLLHL
jgi:hypothetical protein